VHSDPQGLPLANGGSGSVEEMREFLSQNQDQVLSGLLRLGFGTGRLRRTKHALVHWVGERVAAVSRGRLLARRPDMERALGAGLACSVSIEVTCLEDLTLEVIIERVRRASILDDDVVGRDSPQQNVFSVESFREALREEQSRKPAQEAAGSPERSATTWAARDVEDVVALVHSPDGPLTWALFGPRDASRLRKGLCTPGNLTSKSPTLLSGCCSPMSGPGSPPSAFNKIAAPPRSFRWPVPGGV